MNKKILVVSGVILILAYLSFIGIPVSWKYVLLAPYLEKEFTSMSVAGARWVLLRFDNFPKWLQNKTIKWYGKRYKVYLDKEEIPAEQITSRGYKDGYSVYLKLKVISRNQIEITYRWYMGALAAGGRTMRYSWAGVFWIHAQAGPEWIS